MYDKAGTYVCGDIMCHLRPWWRRDGGSRGASIWWVVTEVIRKKAEFLGAFHMSRDGHGSMRGGGLLELSDHRVLRLISPTFPQKGTHTHTRARAHMHTHIGMHACAHAHSRAHTYALTHAHTHIRVRAHTHAHTPCFLPSGLL